MISETRTITSRIVFGRSGLWRRRRLVTDVASLWGCIQLLNGLWATCPRGVCVWREHCPLIGVRALTAVQL